MKKILLVLVLLLLSSLSIAQEEKNINNAKRQIIRLNILPIEANATVFCKKKIVGANEELLGTTDGTGSVANSLELGTYTYRIVSQNCYEKEGSFELCEENGIIVENVTLCPKFARVRFSADDEDCIYINGDKKGISSWSGILMPGKYNVECRRKGCKSSFTTIEILEGVDIDKKLEPSVPIVGVLAVISNPLDAEIIIEGERYGLTPRNIENLTIGNYDVMVSKPGYSNETRIVEILENKTTVLNVTLAPIEDTEKLGDSKESEQIFQVVEQQPEFPGGMKALMIYLRENIVYPQESKKNNSQGRTFVRFVVKADGSIDGVEVLMSSGDTFLDKEAIRVIECMPKWIPGKQGGKPIHVFFTLPVVFRL